MREANKMTKTVERVRRTSINGVRNKLTVRGQDPDYVYRHVLDIDGRVEDLSERGYEIVENKGIEVGDKRVAAASNVGSVVTTNSGDGRKLILMRIKKEYYEEDKKTKEAVVNATEEQLRGHASGNGLTGNIKLTRG